MTKEKTYYWTKLPPLEQKQLAFKVSPRAIKRIEESCSVLKKGWQINEQSAKEEILSVKAEYTFARLYILGNDKKIEIQKELTRLHHFIGKIDELGFDKFKITFKATGKIKPVNIETDFLKHKLIDYIKTLPDKKISMPVGRPPRSTPDIEVQTHCVKELNKRYSGVIRGVNDRFLFIGIVMIGAGIFTDYGLTNREYLITKIKVLARKTGKGNA